MMENYRSKMMKLVIKAKLPSLNEYQDACRANKFRGAKMKGRRRRNDRLVYPQRNAERIVKAYG